MVAVLVPEVSRPIRFASLCISRLNLRPAVDLKAVANACRIPVIRQPPGGPRVEAMLTFHPATERWSIFVDAVSQDTRRRRFSIAHELGHYLLHRHLIRNGHSIEDPDYEDEANEFAGQLLVPTAELKTACELCVPNMDLYFGVTQSAINWRLRQLGYRVW